MTVGAESAGPPAGVAELSLVGLGNPSRTLKQESELLEWFVKHHVCGKKSLMDGHENQFFKSCENI